MSFVVKRKLSSTWVRKSSTSELQGFYYFTYYLWYINVQLMYHTWHYYKISDLFSLIKIILCMHLYTILLNFYKKDIQ